MEFGMPTLIELESLEETASLCRKLGLDFIELNMNFPWYQVENLRDTDKLRKIAEKYGVYYTIHLDENLNVCDFNSIVSKAYLETVKQTIEAAVKLAVPLINFHMHNGIYITLPGKRVELFEQYRERYLEKLELFRDMCEKEIGTEALWMSIENTDGYRSFQVKGIEKLLESPKFSLTWDIGHSFVCGETDEKFLLEHKDRLRHFHIHDAKGKKNHLALGTGDIQLEKRLETAWSQGVRCVVETKTIEALKQSVFWLEANGQKTRI